MVLCGTGEGHTRVWVKVVTDRMPGKRAPIRKVKYSNCRLVQSARDSGGKRTAVVAKAIWKCRASQEVVTRHKDCSVYTSDAADREDSADGECQRSLQLAR